MTKPLNISDKAEIQVYKERIRIHLQQNLNTLSKFIQVEEAFIVFEKMKFDKIGCEPLTGEPENIIEVINQCHTYLVSLMAVETLLTNHPGKSFTVNWGNIPGYDIESTDGTIIAECFAATSYRSNGKLAADLKRLHACKTAVDKYEFFYDKEFTEKNRAYYRDKYPDIEIIKFSAIS